MWRRGHLDRFVVLTCGGVRRARRAVVDRALRSTAAAESPAGHGPAGIGGIEAKVTEADGTSRWDGPRDVY